MSLEARTLERIERDFPVSDRLVVLELLKSYGGPESGRVTWDILKLSRGSLEKVQEFTRAAQVDYRDVLYWAEYYDDDHMLRERNPKEIVNEIIRKWGSKQVD